MLEKSQTALGKFYKQFSNGLIGGEVFLDEVSSSASKSLNKFEIKADKANLAVGDSLDTITRINEKNAQLLKDLEKLNQNLGKIHSYQHLSDRKSHSCRRRAFLRRNW